MTPADLARHWTSQADDLTAKAKRLANEGMYQSAEIKRTLARQLHACARELTEKLTLANQKQDQTTP